MYSNKQVLDLLKGQENELRAMAATVAAVTQQLSNSIGANIRWQDMIINSEKFGARTDTPREHTAGPNLCCEIPMPDKATNPCPEVVDPKAQVKTTMVERLLSLEPHKPTEADKIAEKINQLNSSGFDNFALVTGKASEAYNRPAVSGIATQRKIAEYLTSPIAAANPGNNTVFKFTDGKVTFYTFDSGYGDFHRDNGQVNAMLLTGFTREYIHIPDSTELLGSARTGAFFSAPGTNLIEKVEDLAAYLVSANIPVTKGEDRCYASIEMSDALGTHYDWPGLRSLFEGMAHALATAQETDLPEGEKKEMPPLRGFGIIAKPGVVNDLMESLFVTTATRPKQ